MNPYREQLTIIKYLINEIETRLQLLKDLKDIYEPHEPIENYEQRKTN